jgi:hypothetical protein
VSVSATALTRLRLTFEPLSPSTLKSTLMSAAEGLGFLLQRLLQMLLLPCQQRPQLNFFRTDIAHKIYIYI